MFIEMVGKRKRELDEQLDDEATMANVWKHLLPDIKFDVERFRMLRGLNIQQNITARKVESCQ